MRHRKLKVGHEVAWGQTEVVSRVTEARSKPTMDCNSVSLSRSGGCLKFLGGGRQKYGGSPKVSRRNDYASSLEVKCTRNGILKACV